MLYLMIMNLFTRGIWMIGFFWEWKLYYCPFFSLRHPVVELGAVSDCSFWLSIAAAASQPSQPTALPLYSNTSPLRGINNNGNIGKVWQKILLCFSIKRQIFMTVKMHKNTSSIFHQLFYRWNQKYISYKANDARNNSMPLVTRTR